jgi:Helix-turn-helix domain
MNPAERGFDGRDRQRLCRALAQAGEARFFRRLQAVLLIAQGRQVIEVAQITGLSRRSVYYLLGRYLHSHQVEALADQPRAGTDPAPDSPGAAALALEAGLPHQHLDRRDLGSPPQ